MINDNGRENGRAWKRMEWKNMSYFCQSQIRLTWDTSLPDAVEANAASLCAVYVDAQTFSPNEVDSGTLPSLPNSTDSSRVAKPDGIPENWMKRSRNPVPVPKLWDREASKPHHKICSQHQEV
ncbi:Hypothetical protein NTJ_02670 [Nesidiocoris tenuis]|uniref:Uncharacterized protein n=1 Tax=Nesidiocoris tenuis TaxID=355587 RepID=A0ABN7AC52_9HEMI|nr:Hypothetical protein NTJ_02670 [Nesidiocoris tenuis]